MANIQVDVEFGPDKDKLEVVIGSDIELERPVPLHWQRRVWECACDSDRWGEDDVA